VNVPPAGDAPVAPVRDLVREADEGPARGSRGPDLRDRDRRRSALPEDARAAADEDRAEREAVGAEGGRSDAREPASEQDVARADDPGEDAAAAPEDDRAPADEGDPAAVVERGVGEAREGKPEGGVIPGAHDEGRRGDGGPSQRETERDEHHPHGQCG